MLEYICKVNIGAFVVAIILVVVFVAGMAGKDLHDSIRKEEEDAVRRGRAAYVAGLSAESNPYKGRAGRCAELWFDGFLEAKAEAK